MTSCFVYNVYVYRIIKKLLQQLFTDNVLLLAMNYVTKPVSLFSYHSLSNTLSHHMCMHTRTHMRAHTRTHMYAHTHACTHTHTHTHTHTSMRSHLQAWKQARMHTTNLL